MFEDDVEDLMGDVRVIWNRTENFSFDQIIQLMHVAAIERLTSQLETSTFLTVEKLGQIEKSIDCIPTASIPEINNVTRVLEDAAKFGWGG